MERNVSSIFSCIKGNFNVIPSVFLHNEGVAQKNQGKLIKQLLEPSPVQSLVGEVRLSGSTDFAFR